MKTAFGLPVANADNIFDVFKSLGMVKWEKCGEPIPIQDYLKRELSEEEVKDLRYMPKIEVAHFLDPSGKVFRGFRSRGYNGVVVFTILPGDLVPVCAEFRHGCEEIMLDLPGGLVESGEEDPAVRAKKEMEEESGIVLDHVIPLSSIGTVLFARQMNSRNFSFIGVPKEPIVVRKQDLDLSEYLKIVLAPLGEWLTLIDRERVDSHSVVTTMMALRHLKRI